MLSLTFFTIFYGKIKHKKSIFSLKTFLKPNKQEWYEVGLCEVVVLLPSITLIQIARDLWVTEHPNSQWCEMMMVLEFYYFIVWLVWSLECCPANWIRIVKIMGFILFFEYFHQVEHEGTDERQKAIQWRSLWFGSSIHLQHDNKYPPHSSQID